MAMQPIITGKAYVLGDNVDTDQIIPAQYLTFNPSIPEEYRQFGKYALSSVPPAQAGLPKGHVPFHTKDEFVSDLQDHRRRQEFRLRLVARARPHRPRRGRHRGGRGRVLRPHLLPQLRQRRLPDPVRERRARCATASAPATSCASTLCEGVLHNLTTGEQYRLKPLGEVAPILEAGGVFPYARKAGMLKA